MTSTSLPLIDITDHDGVHELRLARAPVNALSPTLCDRITEAVAAAVQSGASGIVLSGGPPTFSAGLDVPHLLSLSGPEALLDAWERFFAAARALAACPVPVVAAINGHAPAGGCVLALCCDYRVMVSGSARIGLNETQVGLVAPEGIQRLLRRVVGQHRAERMIIAGELVNADRAAAIGLVDALAADADAVMRQSLAWLRGLLALPRSAMLSTRALARADLIDALSPEQLQLPRFVAAWSAPDTQAALRALVARLGR